MDASQSHSIIYPETKPKSAILSKGVFRPYNYRPIRIQLSTLVFLYFGVFKLLNSLSAHLNYISSGKTENLDQF